MQSYLGQILSGEFDKAKEAGCKLANMFLRAYHDDNEESIDKFVYYITSDDKNWYKERNEEVPYELCLAMSILPEKIIEDEIGLKIQLWDGGHVELVWSGK